MNYPLVSILISLLLLIIYQGLNANMSQESITYGEEGEMRIRQNIITAPDQEMESNLFEETHKSDYDYDEMKLGKHLQSHLGYQEAILSDSTGHYHPTKDNDNFTCSNCGKCGSNNGRLDAYPFYKLA